MVLGVSEPTFPFDSYLQAKTQYSPKYVAGTELGKLTEILPQLIQFYQQAKAKKDFQQLLSGSQQQPVTAGIGGAASAVTQKPNLSALAGAFGAANPQQENPFIKAIAGQYDPTVQAQNALRMAQTNKATAETNELPGKMNIDTALKESQIKRNNALAIRAMEIKSAPLNVLEKSMVQGIAKKVQTDTPFTDGEIQFARQRFGATLQNVRNKNLLFNQYSPSASGMEKITGVEQAGQQTGSDGWGDLQVQ